MQKKTGKKRQISLFSQVLWHQSHTFMLISLAFFVVFFVEIFLNFRHYVVDDLHQNATLIEISVLPALQFQDERGLEECLNSLAHNKFIDRAFVTDRSGRVLASLAKKGHSKDPKIKTSWKTYTYEFPIMDRGEIIAVLRLDRNLDDLADIIWRAILSMVGIGLALIIGSWYLRNRIRQVMNDSFCSLNECIDSLSSNRILDISILKSSAAQEFHGVIDHVGRSATTIRLRDEALNKINEELEQRVSVRTEEIRQLHEKMVLDAHKAGMADVASGILHNFGNILNSLMIETHTLQEQRAHPETKTHLEQVFDTMRPEKFQQIFSDPEKTARFVEYVKTLRLALESADQELVEGLSRMAEQQRLMRSILQYQQNFVLDKEPLQTLPAQELIDLVLKIKDASLKRHKVTVQIVSCPQSLVKVQKARLIHVLTNLLVNSTEAMSTNPDNDKTIRISFLEERNHLRLRLEDTGSGISSENLSNLFKHGFTTKDRGHGFGLHSSANYMTEMGGTLTVADRQPTHGAAFELTMQLANSSVVAA